MRARRTADPTAKTRAPCVGRNVAFRAKNVSDGVVYTPTHRRRWLYTFASENNPNDSQKFIKALFAARPDYGQRILAQRQALFESWQTAFMPESVSIIIEEQNLEHLRDQLFATVNLSEECLFMDDESECLSVDKKTEEESLEEEEELELVEAVAAAPVAAEEEEEEEDQQDGEIIP